MTRSSRRDDRENPFTNPKKPPPTVLAFYLPPDLSVLVDPAARAAGKTRGEWLEGILRSLLGVPAPAPEPIDQ